MDGVKKLGNDIRDGWNRLESKKKQRLIILVVLAVLVIIGVTYFTQRKTYTVLFSNLEEADAGVIVEDLEANGMSYQLEDNGTTILIDEKEVDKYRIDLATEGLMPSRSTGFEIFDDAGMMTTDDDRAVMYQRAITGELERAISSLSNVRAAQVMLSLPEESIFQNPEYASTGSASVVLDTTGQLSNQSVQGIASLIAGAVDNVPMQQIQIVDTSGNLLSGFLQNGGDDFNATELTTQHQSIRRAFEEDMEQRIRNLIGGNTRVSVYAEMDFEAVEGERVEYSNPMEDEIVDGEVEQERRGLLRSETVSGRGVTDYAGLIDIENQPEFDDEDGAAGGAAIDTTRNYELNQTSERYARAPGIVTDISATVIVDNEVVTALGTADTGQIQEMIARAIGIRQEDENGDAINLDNHIFVQAGNLTTEDDGPDAIGGGMLDQLVALVQDGWPYLFGSFVLFLIAIVILITLRRREADEELEDFEELNQNPMIPLEPEKVEPQVDLEEEQRQAAREQKNKAMNDKEEKVRNTAKENPELAAELMKVWMTSDK
jgi:flagellar M-ring protein FliF